ncbi:hypothetical protein NMG60_11016532 [Bertholletia excelsa]
MVNLFICGSGAFHQQVEEDDEPYCVSPKKLRKYSLFGCKDYKNPYASRGLDKFSALLAELDDKRQKIYTQMGANDISFVRFMYSSSNDCKPIVVRVRERIKQKKTFGAKENNQGCDNNNHPSEALAESPVSQDEGKIELGAEKSEKRSCYWRVMFEIRRPCCYLPAVVILILLLLAVYGRLFVILCTSLGWYLVPTVHGDSSTKKRPRKKKGGGRRATRKKVVG